MNKISAIAKLTHTSNMKAYELMLSFPDKFLCVGKKQQNNSLKDVAMLTMCSPYELDNLIKEYPEILNFNKNELIQTIKYLQNTLSFDDDALHYLFRANPKTILLEQPCTERLIKVFMKKYQMSTKEIRQIVIECPNVLLLSDNQANDFYNKMYKTEFYKKNDIKEIVTSCPDALFLDTKIINDNLEQLSKYFKLTNPKRKIQLFRATKKALTMETKELIQKLVNLDTLNVHLSHLSFYPEVLNENTKVVAAKKAILELYNLDYFLDDVISLSIEQILTRIEFLKNNNYPLVDIALSKKMFEAKYNNFIETLKNTTLSKEKIEDIISKIILLPYHDIKINVNNVTRIMNNISAKEVLAIIKLNYDRNTTLKLILETIGIDENIIKLILQKTPIYISINEIFATICEILSNFNHDETIKIVEKTQNILCFNRNLLANYLKSNKLLQ